MEPEGEIIFTEEFIQAMDIIYYGAIILFLLGIGLLFLGIVNFVKGRFPIKGRLSLGVAYLLMMTLCFQLNLEWVGFMWLAASVLMMLDLRLYELKQRKDEDRDSERE